MPERIIATGKTKIRKH